MTKFNMPIDVGYASSSLVLIATQGTTLIDEQNATISTVGTDVIAEAELDLSSATDGTVNLSLREVLTKAVAWTGTYTVDSGEGEPSAELTAILSLTDTVTTNFTSVNNQLASMATGVSGNTSALTTIDNLCDSIIVKIDDNDASVDTQLTSIISTLSNSAPIGRDLGDDVILYLSEGHTLTLNTAADYSARNLVVTCEVCGSNVDIVKIEDGDLTKTSSGVSFTIPTAMTASTGKLEYSLRDADDKQVLKVGRIIIRKAPDPDA